MWIVFIGLLAALGSFCEAEEDSAPSLTEIPDSLYEVLKYTDVTLPCGADRLRTSIFKWKQDGDDVQVSERKYVQDNGDLVILSATLEDNGSYKCFAIDVVGDISPINSRRHLVVRKRTHILRGPKDEEVVEGEQVVFECLSVADDKLSMTYEWQVNGQTIGDNDLRRQVVSRDDSGVTKLTIANVTEVDMGTYLCIVKTKLDNASAEATLIVVDVPNAPYQEDVDCMRRSAIVSWRPMGDNRSPISTYEIKYNTSFDPNVWKVAVSDIQAFEWNYDVPLSPWVNYTFVVFAKNKVGLSRPSSLSSVCSTEPDVPYKNPDDVRSVGSSPGTLNISWTVMPPLEHNGPGFMYRVSWKRADVGEKEWENVFVKDWQQGSLYVDNQATFQPYNIRVEAWNMLGPANTAPLEIIGYSGEGQPDPVSSINAVPMGSTAVKVTWSPPRQTYGNLKGYRIYLDNGWHVSHKKDAKVIVVDEQFTSTRLIGLQPSTKYQVSIAAETNGGLSNVYTVDVTTGHESRRPVDKPKFDVARLTTADGAAAVRVTWLPDLDGHPGNHFYVQYRPKGEWAFQRTMNVLYEESINITVLLLKTKYEFRIVAVDGGYETPSDVIILDTGSKAEIGASVDIGDSCSSGKLPWEGDKENLPEMRLPFNVASFCSDYCSPSIPNSWTTSSSGRHRSGVIPFWAAFFVVIATFGSITSSCTKRSAEFPRFASVTMWAAIFVVFLAASFSTFCHAEETGVPSITELPESFYETVEDAKVTLTCRAVGSPALTIRWKHDGHYVVNTERKYVEDIGDLVISNVRLEDAGRYMCIVINMLGADASNDSLGQLVVRRRTRITDGSRNKRLTAGMQSTFQCVVVADSHLPVTVEWQHNGHTIDFTDNNNQRRRMTYEDDEGMTILIISNVTVQDSGIYRCLAKTKLDNASAEATLFVQDVPNAPQLLGVHCMRMSANISWRPMGDNQSPLRDYVIEYNTSYDPDTWHDNADLVSKYHLNAEIELRPWTNYTFRVLAGNSIGLSKPSSHSSVCSTAPDVPYNNPVNVRSVDVSPGVLHISWEPMLPSLHNGPGFFYRVFWNRLDEKGGEPESKDIHDEKQDSLTIDNQPTYAQYSIGVEAHNSIGKSNAHMREIYAYSGADVPLESPANLSLHQIIDGRTAEFGWERVSDDSYRGKVAGYRIESWHCEEDANETDEVHGFFVEKYSPYAIVSTLRPFSKNCARVMAYNGRYEGPPSNVVTIETPEEKPGPVSSFNVYHMGSTAFKLTWSPPSEINGNLKGYRIQVKRVKGEWTSGEYKKLITVDPKYTSTRVIALQPSATYKVSIAAETNAGFGSDLFVEATTHHESRLGLDKPTFELSRIETTDGLAGVRVTWLPDLDGHSGSHFYVEYRPRGSELFQKPIIVLYEDSVDVTALQPQTTYEFRVVAVSGEGYEEPSDVQLFGPPEDQTKNDKKCLPVNVTDYCSSYCSDYCSKILRL